MTDTAESTPEPRHPRLRQLLEEIAEVDRRAREVAGGLSRDQLLWRPGDAWGVGDCLEHLAVTAELYVPRVRSAVEAMRASGRTAPPPGEGERPWKRTLAGRFLLAGVTGRRKLPAPKAFRPPETPRQDVFDGFLAGQRQVEELVRAADGLPITRIRFATPVSSLLRLHAGEAFEILEAHARRHLDQARRVREHGSFPTA